MTLLTRLSAFLCICLCFAWAGCGSVENRDTPKASAGLFDARRLSFTEPVSLQGEWKLFWKKRLTAPAFAPDSLVSLPSLWNGYTLNGQRLPAEGYASFQLTVLLPANRPALALDLPDVYCAYALYANGRLLAANGRVDTSAEGSKPQWLPQTVDLPATGDTLHLSLQVANFWHSKAGVNETIRIGRRQQMFLADERNQSFDLLLTGCLFMGGLFFFGLYLFGRHDKAILYFSLFCMMYSYRIIGSSSYALHRIFPDLSWYVTVRLEYASLFLSIAFFALYTAALYPLDVRRSISRGMVWFCLVFAGFSLLTPPHVFTMLINAFLVAMFLFIAYAFYVYIKAVRNRRVGSVYALLSTGVVLLVFCIINLHYFGYVNPLKGLVFSGYIAFFFLQSLILSYRFANELKTAKEQAEQGLRAKSEFLSTMSHEIRTPLNAVIGTAHLMKRNNPRPDQLEQLDIMIFSANNLLSLVNNILDFNKIEAEKIHFENIPFDVVSLARNCLYAFRQAADDKGLQLVFESDPALQPLVVGDPMRLSQVLTNLVHNAIKFTHQGWVKLSLAALPAGEGQQCTRFTVADSGIGIAREKQNLIFEQFTQADSSTSRSYGGTGLGLAISKRIIDMMGGTLQLQSTEGRGSEFSFALALPLAPAQNSEDPAAPAVPAEPERPLENKPLEGKKILLVEDNALNVFVAKSFLERWGALVDVATNGQQALDAFNPARHQLILMDMHMPVMDGYEATRALRAAGHTVPVIALTASISKESESKVYTVGVNDIVIKPFNPDRLLTAVLGQLS